MADILDNSISAGANNIWISRIWKGGQSIITIKDDGIGMNHQELIEAMRPGSQNPLEERSKSDLGRFGLGLKTASFSQCRILTVYSKRLITNPFIGLGTWTTLQKQTNGNFFNGFLKNTSMLLMMFLMVLWLYGQI